jgi:hypothetical protein
MSVGPVKGPGVGQKGGLEIVGAVLPFSAANFLRRLAAPDVLLTPRPPSNSLEPTVRSTSGLRGAERILRRLAGFGANDLAGVWMEAAIPSEGCSGAKRSLQAR